jgi:hypothetical protein
MLEAQKKGTRYRGNTVGSAEFLHFTITPVFSFLQDFTKAIQAVISWK